MSGTPQNFRRPVKTLPPEVARKIAAGEVIDRPAAIVRELMDNAVDSGADMIHVEITGGGIDRIRVVDNGSGMTKEDLEQCARPHATSKIATEADLLNLSTLGFRGEALSSIAAVCRLQIISACDGSAWKLEAEVTKPHRITPADLPRGTVVQTESLFENFPARRVFLKRPASETMLCRQIFIEKAIPRTDISFRLSIDGRQRLDLPAGQTPAERLTAALDFTEPPDLFYELHGSGSPEHSDWKFTLIIGEPAVSRSDKKHIYIYVNGRRITEYALVQAIEYGAQGFFPNGTHPAAALFLEINPALVDFNIHPAKREARFKDLAPVHHAVSSTIRNFFRQHSIAHLAARIITQQDALLQPELYTSVPEPSASWCADSSPVPSRTTIPNPTGTVAEHPQKASGFRQHQPPANQGNQDLRTRFFSDSYCAAPPADTVAVPEPDTPADSVPPVPDDTVPPDIRGRTAPVADNNVRYIGNTLGVFLAAEKNETLYLIDQHAAHERILYNQFIARAGESQQLLIPYVLETAGETDDIYLEQISGALTQAGFTLKNCGDGRWECSRIPVQWHGTEADLEQDLLTRRIAPEELIASLAATNACRAAVKDGDILDPETASRLAAEALALEDPHCPHGRPLWVAVTKAALFAGVKRT